MLDIGDAAPDFTLRDQDGNEVRWSDLRGKPVAVFFYPKADTPGCTKEACAFRDLAAEFEAAGARVLGISADSSKKQKSFEAKYGLNMPLLSDEGHAVLEPWGVWAEKKNYGKSYMGIVRSTFLFDAEGKVRKVWRNVKVDGHADAVLDETRKLAS